MDFRDQKYIEILRSTTKTRESFKSNIFNIALDDDRNYYNDEFLIFMGDHSKIKKIPNKDGKLEFALKIMNLNKIMKSDSFYLELIHNEINHLTHLDHPNIIQLKEFFKDQKYFYIIYELAEFGNLLNFYKNVQVFDENQVFKFFFQILLAVDYLHGNNFIHRFIKLQNILIDSYHNLKLSNFKYASKADQTKPLPKEFLEENLEYFPPEVLLSQHFSKKSDIWSLGIILYELLSKLSPFNGIINEHTIHNILNSSSVLSGRLSHSLKSLLSLLLSKDPKERPTTREILKHEWITQNLHKNDISFLYHPIFISCNKIDSILNFFGRQSSHFGKDVDDIRKISFFKSHPHENNKGSKIIMMREETNKFPNIFHDRHFEKSSSQKSLKKSQNEFKNNNTRSNISCSPYRQNKIFDPLHKPILNDYNLPFDQEEVYQRVERYSVGNQEEQRFSCPVYVEKRKRNEDSKNTSSQNQKNIILNKSQNLAESQIPTKKSGFYSKTDYSYNKDVSERYQDMSGVSYKSNNKNLYFDHDFSDKNLYI